jgi:hypothetical protein
MTGDMCKHKVQFTRDEFGVGGINVMLVGLELDGKHGDVIIKLAIVGNLPGQTPVIDVSNSPLKKLEVCYDP